MPQPSPAVAKKVTNHKGNHLLGLLDVADGAKGVFGIAYSILTWSGLFKGFSLTDPHSWMKVAGKGFEDGHATTFMIDLDERTFTMTGISDDAWVFYGGELDAEDWARPTDNAKTDLYYICMNKKLVSSYERVRGELEKQKVAYAALAPNLGSATRYENCVSSSHVMVNKLGLGWGRTGTWMPSVSNWVTWLNNSGGTYAKDSGFEWKHRHVDGCNTHIP